MIEKTIKDFIIFLKKPNDVQLQIDFKQKFSTVSMLFLAEIIFTFIIAFPLLEGVDKILNIKSPKFDYSETILTVIFISIIIIPLLEELFFRYFLRYQGFKIKIISRTKWENIFPFLVYTLAISFGFMHISNFLNDEKLFYILSPFIIISQLFGGLIITYIRVRLNFRWAVFYHSFWNLIFILLIPLIDTLFYKPFVEITSNHSIIVKEKSYFNKNKPQIIKIDSVSNKIQSIDIEQYSLQNILDTIYNNETYYVDDVLINLKFKSKEGITKQNFLEILKKEYEIE